jgi:hypothetical protein
MMKTVVTIAVFAAILAVRASRADSVYGTVDVGQKEAGAVVELETAPITAGCFLFTSPAERTPQCAAFHRTVDLSGGNFAVNIANEVTPGSSISTLAFVIAESDRPAFFPIGRTDAGNQGSDVPRWATIITRASRVTSGSPQPRPGGLTWLFRSVLLSSSFILAMIVVCCSSGAYFWHRRNQTPTCQN